MSSDSTLGSVGYFILLHFRGAVVLNLLKSDCNQHVTNNSDCNQHTNGEMNEDRWRTAGCCYRALVAGVVHYCPESLDSSAIESGRCSRLQPEATHITMVLKCETKCRSLICHDFLQVEETHY